MSRQVVRVPVRVSSVLAIVPPRPCALGDCVAEVEISTAVSALPLRVHLNESQRLAVIDALGGR